MLSVNHSVEDIHNYPYPQRTSQMNPNMSLTNILQLNQPKALKNSFQKHYRPITPPASNSPTPVEKSGGFTFGSAAGSTTSLDTLASAHGVHEAARSKWASLASKLLPQIDPKVVALCSMWYALSIVSSSTTKAILSGFSYPVTLTQFQFLLNVVLCVGLFVVLTMVPSHTKHFPQGSIPNLHNLNHSVWQFLLPNSFIISTTLPMGIFQFMGHTTSHKATSVIPVSLVHTIKALSPITTVLIYKFIFRTKFRAVTYVTLVPLIIGIMLTCYKPKHSLVASDEYFGGLIYAFVSMFIFVSQNIFAKKRLTIKPEGKELPSFNNNEEKKLDKLTILLFCSIIGFAFTMPVYIILELRNDTFSLSEVSPALLFLVVVNGASHFLQSLLAFQLLGTISPINYSIANIMKRIVVILFAFFWESSFSFSGTQSYGIVMTVAGLYCYDKWGIARN